MHRTQLFYPAYRMHGSKFGKELWTRFNKNSDRVVKGIGDIQIQSALLWLSESAFFGGAGQSMLPKWLTRADASKHPMLAAAQVNVLVNARWIFDRPELRELIATLRTAAPSQRDAYYRYWFNHLANALDERLERERSRFDPMGFMSRFLDDDSDEDDEYGEDDDDMNFDPNCNCPSCSAARRAYQAKQSGGSPK
jgi:hypothetical protein